MTTSLCQQWICAKAVEVEAIKTRRDIEDVLLNVLDVPDTLDGSINFDAGSHKVRIEGRINRKINSEKLQELAAESGLTEHLSSLFRWKPEVNIVAWKAASPEITTLLIDAITSTPGRPSFTIANKE